MACGGCGGSAVASRAIQRRAINTKTKPAPVSGITQVPRIRPASTVKVVINSPSVIVKTKENIKNLTLCPLCGSKLSPILSGSGARNRKRCTRCNRTFV